MTLNEKMLEAIANKVANKMKAELADALRKENGSKPASAEAIPPCSLVAMSVGKVTAG